MAQNSRINLASQVENEYYHYIGVKGYPYAEYSCVFGLTSEEVLALIKRFPDRNTNDKPQSNNSTEIYGSPYGVINALAELGYKVIASTGNEENKFLTMSRSSGVRQSLFELEFERGIWHAALNNDLKKIEKFLDKGVSPDAEDSAGYRALHYAARNGNYEACKILLENGAKIDSRTRSGQATPLQRAAAQGHKEVVELLLNFKANPALQDADGFTALHRAIIEGRISVCKILIPRTNLELKDNRGRSVKELANEKCKDLLDLFNW